MRQYGSSPTTHATAGKPELCHAPATGANGAGAFAPECRGSRVFLLFLWGWLSVLLARHYIRDALGPLIVVAGAFLGCLGMPISSSGCRAGQEVPACEC